MNDPVIGMTAKRQLQVQRCIASACAAEYGTQEMIYVCRRCGSPLEVDCRMETLANPERLPGVWEARGASRELRDRSGVWRYREVLPFGDDVTIISLFEGNTPIYNAPRSASYAGLAQLKLKHQGCNPTGSFKDTGMTVAVTQAARLGVRAVVCASTGNTAASLAAYAARADLVCAVLLPEGQVSPAKVAQSMDYGARIFEIEGNFDDCMRLIEELSGEPSIYVANSINPFRIEGQKTVAYEMLQQLAWKVPDHVVVPGGNMGNSAALGKGFGEMRRLGLIERMPKLSVVQAKGAAPLAHMFEEMKKNPREHGTGKDPNRDGVLQPVSAPKTLATAIKIGSPVSWKKALRAVLQSGGDVIAVSEQEIADAKAMIGRDGIGCEPASATTVAGIKNLVAAGKIKGDESVVGVLTGHVLKDPDYVSRYHSGTLALAVSAEGEASEPVPGNFRNMPLRVAASKDAVLNQLQRER